jgi:hypothetical protein
MIRIFTTALAAVVCLLLFCSAPWAQQPSGQPLPPAEPVAPPPADPGMVTSGPMPMAATTVPAAECVPTCKVCVCEPKQNTKICFSSKCEDYCLPRCSLLSLFRGKCGCEDGCCGDVRTRHLLIVKKVPACDTKKCVLKEVPAVCAPPCAPGP